MMDEKNIREIARGHGWPESEFIAEFKRLVKNYGYTKEGAQASEDPKHGDLLGAS